MSECQGWRVAERRAKANEGTTRLRKEKEECGVVKRVQDTAKVESEW